MSISTKLQELNQVKLDIKQALIDKEVDMTGVPFTEYASKIGELGGGIDILWEPSDGTSFFTQVTSNFEYAPSIQASGNSAYPSNVYAFYAYNGKATVSFPVDFTKYKYYGVIFGGYSYYSQQMGVVCGNYSKSLDCQQWTHPTTHILSKDNTGITTGVCELSRTRNNSGGVRGQIFKVFATNAEIGELML